MFDYFQEFNKLPKEIRDKVSSPEVMAEIDNLERKYKVELASFVMKTMTKKIPLNSLALYLSTLLKVKKELAINLEKELLEKVFVSVKDYLKDSKTFVEKGVSSDVDSVKLDQGNKQKEIKKNLETIEKSKLPGMNIEVDKEKRKIDLDYEKNKDSFNKEVSSNILNNNLSYRKDLNADKPKNVVEAEVENKAQEIFNDLLKSSGRYPLKKQENIEKEEKNKGKVNLEISSVGVNDISEKVEKIIKETNIILSSSHLISRFKFVLTTYIKGVRDKISTRSVLSRSPNEGGLGLDQISIDKVFKAVKSFSEQEEKKQPIKKVKPFAYEEEKSKIDSLNEVYDFKKSIKEKEEKEKEKEGKNPFNVPSTEVKNKEGEKLLDTVKDIKKVTPQIAPPPPAILDGKDKEDLVSGRKEEQVNKNLELVDKNKHLEKRAEKESDKKIEEKKKVDLNDKKNKFSFFHHKKNNKDEKIKESKEEIRDGIKKEGSEIKGDGDGSKKEKQINKKDEFSKIFEDKSSRDEILNFDPKKIKEENNKVKFNPKPSTNKPRLDDIRVVDRVMGPIDELHNLDLVDFRRLGKTCEDRISKIKDKLDLLEKDSYDKMILGIEAWRKNPLNILYRNITIDSINNSLPIKEVIDRREKNGQDTLSFEELQALVDFNREITF
ncbi:hypothetical protein EOL94_01740 [bacterium]|nr:hypothetical protein [bacterium]